MTTYECYEYLCFVPLLKRERDKRVEFVHEVICQFGLP